MKIQILVSALLVFALQAQTPKDLQAQTPEELTPSATGVSDLFRNYAAPISFDTASASMPGAGVELRKLLTIDRGNGSLTSSVVGAAVAAPPSTMFNQTSNGTLPVTVSKNYTGLGTGFNGTWTNQGLLPPDTTMGVGLSQIVQWVNLRLTVLDKSTGATLLGGVGFIQASQIWSGLPGSLCATNNDGDPQVQYDRIAGRWVLMQFAFVSETAGPYAMCWAVSQTADATGAYNLYQYSVPSLPDYSKIGVWPDAYYLTANDYTGAGPSFVGTRYCAFNRTAMIAGTAASAVCFTGLGTNGDHFAAIPGDFEGTILPPVNETEFIVNGNWFSLSVPPYALQLRRFHPDFVTPANSTLNDGLGGAFDSFVSLPFDNSVIGACGDAGGACVPQPGTTRRLDTLSMRTMYRLAYRNLGANRETLVFTQTVDPAGAGVAGIQLIEIRNPAGSPPTIYNNVNLNPDATNRWMGSAATDKLGNVGVGYSVSSSTLSPGIRIAGRLRNDIKNSLRGEINVQTGSGSQTATAQRWGDYSAMQVDPSDDCTLWYTTEYIINTAAADWATRIIGFKFNNCQ